MAELETNMWGENTSSSLYVHRTVEAAEIARCLRSLKTGGSDVLVGELMKCGGKGMVDLLHQWLFVV